MPGDSRLKCAECTRRGKPCVSLSWESLNATRDNLREELAEDEARRDELAFPNSPQADGARRAGHLPGQ